jgi:hypothetical protein
MCHILNDLERDGWRLVSSTPSSASLLHIFHKEGMAAPRESAQTADQADAPPKKKTDNEKKDKKKK